MGGGSRTTLQNDGGVGLYNNLNMQVCFHSASAPTVLLYLHWGYAFIFYAYAFGDTTHPTIDGFDDVLTPTLEARLIQRPSILVSYG